MIFRGIARKFSLENEGQYDTIGEFWDEMALRYGLENLVGLGYEWSGGEISYAIGLKAGDIDGCNLTIELPDSGWTLFSGRTDDLKEIYNEIYKVGPLKYEIETFDDEGGCLIKYYR